MSDELTLFNEAFEQYNMEREQSSKKISKKISTKQSRKPKKDTRSTDNKNEVHSDSEEKNKKIIITKKKHVVHEEESNENNEESSKSNEKIIEETLCDHSNFIAEKGVCVCVDCGEEIEGKKQERDWKQYGHGDTKHVSDPNRVQMRKNEERSIYRDVENLGISEKIVAMANKLYAQVTKEKIFRGKSRRAIVFACVFHAYKLDDKPQSHEKLIEVFGLNRRTGLKGLKHVNLYAPRESKIRNTYITPINLVTETLKSFGATPEQIKEVLILYDKIRNKSSKLNRSRPQSVSAGLVYYWICLKRKNITLKEFAKRVSLSELTISKIAKEITDILTREEDSEVDELTKLV